MFFILRKVDTSAILAALSQSDARYLSLMMALAFFVSSDIAIFNNLLAGASC
jgi:hypothetical protein